MSLQYPIGRGCLSISLSLIKVTCNIFFFQKIYVVPTPVKMEEFVLQKDSKIMSVIVLAQTSMEEIVKLVSIRFKKRFFMWCSVKYDISYILDVCSNEKKRGGVTQPTSLGICVLYLTSRRGIFFKTYSNNSTFHYEIRRCAMIFHEPHCTKRQNNVDVSKYRSTDYST